MFTLFSKSKSPLIYIPQGSGEKLKLAAADLIKDIKDVSDREIEPKTVFEKSDADIIVDICESKYFHPEEFNVIISDKVYIEAKDELGAMWGIYTFSSDILGVHPLSRLNGIIPEKHPSMMLDCEKLDDFPRHYKMRAISLAKSDSFLNNGEYIDRIVDSAVRLKLNAIILPDEAPRDYAVKRGLTVITDADESEIIESGAHFAAAPSPHLIKSRLKSESGDRTILSVHNAREYACIMSAFSQIAWDNEDFDEDEFFKSYCTDTYGCEEVGAFLSEFYDSFDCNGKLTGDMYLLNLLKGVSGDKTCLAAAELCKYTETGLLKFGSVFNKFAGIADSVSVFGESAFVYECILQARYMYDICGFTHFLLKGGAANSPKAVAFADDILESRKTENDDSFEARFERDAIIAVNKLVSFVKNSVK